MKSWSLVAVLAAVLSSAAFSHIPRTANAMPDGIVATSLTLTDMAGNGQLKKVKSGGQFLAMLSATSSATVMHEYVAVFEVRDENGYTISLDIYEGLLDPEEIERISAPVSLAEAGDYTVRSFAYSFPAIAPAKGHMAISSIVTAPISVVDIEYDHRTGVIVPLYAYPYLNEPGNLWNVLVEQKLRNPDVPFAVIMNPWSGPGLWQDPNYLMGTAQLRESGVEYVIGYIPTDYARYSEGRAPSDIMAMMDTYRDWYPDVNGILLDEVNSRASHIDFYSEIVLHARNAGFEYVVANPGTRIAEEYIAIFDNLMIYEHRVLPSVPRLQENTYFPAYSPERFSFAVKNVPALDIEYLEQVREYVGFLYMTNDVESVIDPNPYNTLPYYFSDLVEFLDPST